MPPVLTNKKKIFGFLLKAFLVLLSVLLLVWAVVMPQLEGRAAGLSLWEIYTDPFVLYAYLPVLLMLASIFLGLKMVRNWSQNNTLSNQKVAVPLKHLFWWQSILILGAGVYILFFNDPKEDAAGFLALCFLAFILNVGLACAMGRLVKRLGQKAKASDA